MKGLQVCIILGSFCICQRSDSQTPSRIQVLAATYGAGSQQLDVTGKLRSLVQDPKPEMRVSAELFGPASTTSNTLAVAFSYNGQLYQIELRDGEPLSFANAKQVLNPAPTPIVPEINKDAGATTKETTGFWDSVHGFFKGLFSSGGSDTASATGTSTPPDTKEQNDKERAQAADDNSGAGSEPTTRPINFSDPIDVADAYIQGRINEGSVKSAQRLGARPIPSQGTILIYYQLDYITESGLRREGKYVVSVTRREDGTYRVYWDRPATQWDF